MQNKNGNLNGKGVGKTGVFPCRKIGTSEASDVRNREAS